MCLETKNERTEPERAQTQHPARPARKRVLQRKVRLSLLFFSSVASHSSILHPFIPSIQNTHHPFTHSFISFFPHQFHLPTSPLNQRYPIYTHTHNALHPPKNRTHRHFFFFFELVYIAWIKPNQSAPRFNTNCTYPALSLSLSPASRSTPLKSPPPPPQQQQPLQDDGKFVSFADEGDFARSGNETFQEPISKRTPRLLPPSLFFCHSLVAFRHSRHSSQTRWLTPFPPFSSFSFRSGAHSKP